MPYNISALFSVAEMTHYTLNCHISNCEMLTHSVFTACRPVMLPMKGYSCNISLTYAVHEDKWSALLQFIPSYSQKEQQNA